ncbi:hypothetical protein [Adhaeretor mobilis]|uniref:hypothetical protein n=1 Tax=Adhaeretor mobilis TaxID=1930276 RepID=UPI0011A6E5C7|nr:hypothetical protein [Adhaeretor mobilis]
MVSIPAPKHEVISLVEDVPTQRIEAVAKCWCSKTRAKFGVVVTSDTGETWTVQHSFLCSPEHVDAASDRNKKIGQIEISDNFNGCKHCNNDTLIQCSECKEYSCHNTKRFAILKSVTCGNCGLRGVVSGMAKSMKTTGD